MEEYREYDEGFLVVKGNSEVKSFLLPDADNIKGIW